MTVDDDDDDDDDDDCDVNDGVCVFVCLDDTEVTDDRQTERERERDGRTGGVVILQFNNTSSDRRTDGHRTDTTLHAHTSLTTHTHTLRRVLFCINFINITYIRAASAFTVPRRRYDLSCVWCDDNSCAAHESVHLTWQLCEYFIIIITYVREGFCHNKFHLVAI